MAKEQKKGNREAKKPKQEKPKASVAAQGKPAFTASIGNNKK